MARNKSYTEEFRKTLIKKVVLNSEKSVNSIAIDAGIPSSTLRNWIKRAQIKGSGLKKQSKTNGLRKISSMQ